MAGYIIADVEITDLEVYQEYAKLVPPTLEVYGGRHIVRGGEFEVLEGDHNPHRLVVIEFPSYERAIEWARSEEYAPARAMRQRSANTSLIAVKGA
ncbi:MAG: DUF1330 domain-containing protein [Dehalococcoidia bacterium]|nr:DUF1330 domain-containing protein [Dehalococcoidia bacterium]